MSRYEPPTKYKCTKCGVYDANKITCPMCGQVRKGTEKRV